MTTTTPVRLTPSPLRLAAVGGGAIAAVVVPVALILVIASLAPDPFRLDLRRMSEASFGTTTVEGATVTVTRVLHLATAVRTAEATIASIDRRSTSRFGDVFRYTRRDNERRGFVAPIGGLLIHIEGQDDEQVGRALASLPFVVDQRDQDPITVAFTKHLGAVLIGVLAYAVLLLAGITRGGAWAARIGPPAGVIPVSPEELRRRLLAISDQPVPFVIREEDGLLIGEWRLADVRWTGLLERGGLSMAHTVRIRLVPGGHVARIMDSSRKISWRDGVAYMSRAFSFFRGIVLFEFSSGTEYGIVLRDGQWTFDEKYRYGYHLTEIKQPIVEAIVRSGWTYQPVAFIL